MRLITESPFAAGTPEHDHWVRTVFIPGVAAERVREDRAKYGAEAIGGKLVNGRMLDLFDRLTGAVDTLSGAFRSTTRTIDDQLASFHGFMAAGRIQLPMVHFPDWVRTYLGEEELARLCEQHGVEDAHAWSFQQLMGPNRAERRDRREPPLKQQRECPRHGGPAHQCRPCLRSSHAR